MEKLNRLFLYNVITLFNGKVHWCTTEMPVFPSTYGTWKVTELKWLTIKAQTDSVKDPLLWSPLSFCFYKTKLVFTRVFWKSEI